MTIGLCLSWGFNNVAIKLAIHDIPPLIQSAARSAIAALLVGLWTQVRGIPLFRRDGTLRAGILAGVLFALEFLLIYRGLVWTTVTRGTLFLYLAPFFVVIGSRWLVPGDHFHLSQWLGLLLSFVGIVIAFGLPTPAVDPHQALGDLMLVGAAAAWAARRWSSRSARSTASVPRKPCSTSSWFRRRSWPPARWCLANTSTPCRRRWRSALSPIRRSGS